MIGSQSSIEKDLRMSNLETCPNLWAKSRKLLQLHKTRPKNFVGWVIQFSISGRVRLRKRPA